MSQELEILKLEILIASKGASPEQNKQLFDERMKFAKIELNRLQSVADGDLCRSLTTRVESLGTTTNKSTDFATGAAQLLTATQDIQKEISNWTDKQEKWLKASSQREAILGRAQKLQKDSPYAERIKQLMKAADNLALNVRDYSTAHQFVDQCQKLISEAEDYEKPIRLKIAAFQKADPALLKLCNEVKLQLDRLVEAVRAKQRKLGQTELDPSAYSSLGQVGKDYAECVRLASEYRTRAEQSRLEAWGSYPEVINEATRKLEAAKLQLDKMLSAVDKTNHAVNKIVQDCETQARNEKLLKAWMTARGNAEKELERLSESVGPHAPEYRDQSSQFQLLLNTHDGVKVQYDVGKLNQFTNQVKRLADDCQKKREELQKKRADVRDEWNRLLEKQDVFPESYYQGISDEYDNLKIYLDSPNLAVVEFGLKKRQELLERFKSAVATPDKIREGAATYDRLVKLLANNQKALETYQPSRLANFRFTLEELAKVVHTEDPSTLLPKLNGLESEINLCLKNDVENIKQFRQNLEPLARELTQLYADLLQAYEKLPQSLPKGYQPSIEKVGKQHLLSAQTLEDLTLAQSHRQRLEELQAKLKDVLKSSSSTSVYFNSVELTHVTQEEKRQEQLEQQRLAYEKELQIFNTKPYNQLTGFFANWGWGEDRAQAVNQTLARAKDFAKKEDYGNALKELRVAIQAARTVTSQPESGKLNDSLKGLAASYRGAIEGVKEAAKATVVEIEKICQGIVQQKTGADATDLLRQVQQLTELLKGVTGTELDDLIEVLRDPERSDRREKAEVGLQVVRQQLKCVSSDPLLRLLARNPFKVKTPHLDLKRALQNLELALQTAK